MVETDLASLAIAEREPYSQRRPFVGPHYAVNERTLENWKAPQSASDLVAVAYRSKRSPEFDDHELSRMLQAARRKNAALGLSGLLLVRGDSITQWLEGPERVIDKMMDRILCDPRHTDISVVERRRVSKRFFGPWTMVMASDRVMPGPRLNASTVPPADLLQQVDAESDRLLPFFENAAEQFWPIAEVRSRMKPVPEPAPLGLASVVAARIEPALRAGLLAENRGPRDTGAHWKLAASGLKRLLLEGNSQAVTHFLRRMTEGRADPVGVQVSLIEETARQLGNAVSEGGVAESDVLLALSNLVMALRQLNMSPEPVQATVPRGPTVLVTTRPGERHFLSAVLAAEVLWHRNWAPQVMFPLTDSELITEVARRPYAAVHIALCTESADQPGAEDFALLIKRVRASSKNPEIAITIGGRAACDAPGRLHDLGADGLVSSVGALDDVLRSVIPA